MAADIPRHILHRRRRAGVLLHPTSLPDGRVCHDAYRFIEFLAEAGMGAWQTLPLGPVHTDGSPYHALSACACDAGLISLAWLHDRGLLARLPDDTGPTVHRQCLQQAWDGFSADPDPALHAAFERFVTTHADWLEDYALFMTIRATQGDRAWTAWPVELRDRQRSALEQFAARHASQVGFHRFLQFVIFSQWQDLKRYAAQHDILLFGDLPIYVALDSVDVWARRELFQLDADGQPRFVAGVPPDYFSTTGQRWGNPQFDWDAMQAAHFDWWQTRLETQLALYDVIRVDHFRGFQAYWEIAADEETAVQGRWVEAPGHALLAQLHDTHGDLPLVAEDLGVITAEVTALREAFDLPGMKILQFAFDGRPENAYLPHNHAFNTVVYTGTHDNDTTVGWYAALDEATRDQLHDYLALDGPADMPWSLIRAALASPACLAMLPMQDLLALGSECRMNTPGTTQGNWGWRLDWSQVEPDLAARCRHLVALYGRAG